MAFRSAMTLLLVSGLVVAGLTGCGAKTTEEPATEASQTANPETGYLTEPPKKAEDATSKLNDATQGTEDAVEDVEGD